MPYFKLRDRIRLQDKPNHFIWLGPGIVEVDDDTAKHGYLLLVGEKVEGPDGKKVEKDKSEVKGEETERTVKDLNPGKAPAPEIRPAPSVNARQAPAPLVPFGEGPKSLAQREAELAEANRLRDEASKPVETNQPEGNAVVTDPLTGTQPANGLQPTLVQDPITEPSEPGAQLPIIGPVTTHEGNPVGEDGVTEFQAEPLANPATIPADGAGPVTQPEVDNSNQIANSAPVKPEKASTALPPVKTIK